MLSLSTKTFWEVSVNSNLHLHITLTTELALPQWHDAVLSTDHEVRDGSTMGCFHSVGSDLTRTRELPELQQNVSMQSGQEASAVGKDPSRTPTSVREVYTQSDHPVVKKCYSLGSFGDLKYCVKCTCLKLSCSRLYLFVPWRVECLERESKGL